MKAKCYNQKGSMSFTIKGRSIGYGGWLQSLLFPRWIFQLPSNLHWFQGLIQNCIHYIMGSFLVGCDAFWFKECTTYLLMCS